MTPAEVLAGARDVLAERGWHQGGFMGQDGAVCAMGALRVACFGELLPGQFSTGLGAAHELLARVVEGPIDWWNDAQGRTYEDVILALKQAEELALEQAA